MDRFDDIFTESTVLAAGQPERIFKDRGLISVMKICPRCFAEYEDYEVQDDNSYCIECFGESSDVNVIDLQDYLKTASMGRILAKRGVIMGLDLPVTSKGVILRRIDKIVAQLRH